MKSFVGFMSSVNGRILRVVLGLVLIGVGMYIGGFGLIISAIGLIPITLGAANKCLLSPVVHPKLQH